MSIKVFFKVRRAEITHKLIRVWITISIMGDTYFEFDPRKSEKEARKRIINDFKTDIAVTAKEYVLDEFCLVYDKEYRGRLAEAKKEMNASLKKAVDSFLDAYYGDIEDDSIKVNWEGGV